MRVIFIKPKVFRMLFLLTIFALGFWLTGSGTLRTVSTPTDAKVAIVIDDFGGYAKGVKEMMALPFPMTFAVLPFGEFACSQGEEAAQKGFEVIVHMPFEAIKAKKCWYGEKYISASLTDAEIRELIDQAYRVLPMATGMSNHMGSRATSNYRVMRTVLEENSRVHRFFFNSKTADSSIISAITQELGLPRLERDIFLDEQGAQYHIRRQLNRLVELAREKGAAIGIGHVGPYGPVLARILREEIPRYQREGVRFICLSEFARRRWFNGTIGIDPGHGGIDSGAKAGNILEKILILDFLLSWRKRWGDAGIG